MGKLKRIGIIMAVMGLSLFIGVMTRDSIYLGNAPSNSMIIPPNAYLVVTLPSHYRTEELDIKVITQNSSVQCLILINQYNVTDVIEHFSSQPAFTVNSSGSVEFIANYGTMTLIFSNPRASYVNVQYTIRAKSFDYGVLIIASSLIIVGMVTVFLSHIRTRKKNANGEIIATVRKLSLSAFISVRPEVQSLELLLKP